MPGMIKAAYRNTELPLTDDVMVTGSNIENITIGGIIKNDDLLHDVPIMAIPPLGTFDVNVEFSIPAVPTCTAQLEVTIIL